MPAVESALPAGHPGRGAGELPAGATLPRNHPAIAGDGVVPGRDEPALAWTAPPGWELAPSRSTMRLATFRIPAAPGGHAGAELTVTRAGGSTEDNLARWVGQFEDAGKETRSVRTIAGLQVSTLEVSGTYDGGMSSTGPDSAKTGWSLLGAVVETTGPFYFFKMVGPSEAVRAARPAFEALLGGLRQPS